MTEKKYFNQLKKEWQSVTPNLLESGKKWYPEMRIYISNLAKENNLSLSQVSGIFSCLSPQKSVAENKKLCEAFLKGKRSGHYRRQIKKAEAILTIKHHKTIEKVINGDKTKAFYRHICNPKNNNYCCNDSHIIKICNKGQLLNITPKRYRNMTGAIKKLSKEVGLYVSETQATIWLLSKQKYGNNI